MNDQEEKALPFEMDHLPECFAVKAVIELNETPENRICELKKIRKLAEFDDVTAEINFEEDFLTQFLRRSKYDATKAFSHLKNFIKLKKENSTLFSGVSETVFSAKSSSTFGTILPSRCPDGCSILNMKIGLWDPDELDFEDFKRLALMLFVQPLCDPMTQVNGFKIIHDFGGTSLKHLKYCTSYNLWLQYHIFMNCLPARYKEIHLVNESVILKVIWAVVKHLLPEKIRKRTFFHSKAEDLLNYFPRSVLPKRYGGDLVDYFNEGFMKEMNRKFRTCPLGGQKNDY